MTMSERPIERRNLARPVEWRAANGEGTSPGNLGGYAAVFNKPSQNLGGYVEVVAAGAFTKTLGEARVLCRYNHSDDGLLGTTEAGTLVLTVDDVGLNYDVALPNTSTGRDAAELAARGDLRYSSFAFVCIEDEWGVTPQGFPQRTLLQVQLIDVAPVVNPAYLDSTTGMRSLADHLGLDVAILADKPVEEIRSLLAGEEASQSDTQTTEPASIEAPATEQRSSDEPSEPHSSVLIARAASEWNAKRDL